MTELGWPPERIGGLTIAQLACLGSDHAPAEPGGKRSEADVMMALEEQRAAEAAWRSDDT